MNEWLSLTEFRRSRSHQAKKKASTTLENQYFCYFVECKVHDDMWLIRCTILKMFHHRIFLSRIGIGFHSNEKKINNKDYTHTHTHTHTAASYHALRPLFSLSVRLLYSSTTFIEWMETNTIKNNDTTDHPRLYIDLLSKRMNHTISNVDIQLSHSQRTAPPFPPLFQVALQGLAAKQVGRVY